MARRKQSKAAATQLQRDEALQLAEQHGAAEASRRTGIAAGTIRAWQTRQRQQTGTPADAKAAPTEVERLERELQDARASAEQMLRASREAEKAHQAVNARSYMVSYGVALDKATLIEQRLNTARGIQAQITQAQAATIGALVDQVLTSLDVDSPAAREVVRGLLGQASKGADAMVADAALAEQARAAIRDRLAGVLREQLAGELEGDRKPSRREQRQLPAPAAPHPDGRGADAPDAMAGPRRVVRALRDRARKDDDVEVVTGEVVPAKPKKRGGWGVHGQRKVDDAALAAKNRAAMLEDPKKLPPVQVSLDRDGRPVLRPAPGTEWWQGPEQ